MTSHEGKKSQGRIVEEEEEEERIEFEHNLGFTGSL